MRAWRRRRLKAGERPDADADAPVAALLVDAPGDIPGEIPGEIPVEAAVAETSPAPTVTLESPESPLVVAQLEMQSEFLRLLAVVTSMCDHVIEYIEADRSERRAMIETLAQLSRTITDGAATIPRERVIDERAVGERVIGGSMPARPEPVIDLVGTPEPEPQIETEADARPGVSANDRDREESAATIDIEIAVEVRGRFGDRWVDGFEICEVITTLDGPRYRLRRHRDGVVLPELFDAASIRHVETFDQLNGDQINGSTGYWSRS